MRIVGSPLHRGLVRGSFPAPHHHDPNKTLPNFPVWVMVGSSSTDVFGSLLRFGQFWAHLHVRPSVFLPYLAAPKPINDVFPYLFARVCRHSGILVTEENGVEAVISARLKIARSRRSWCRRQLSQFASEAGTQWHWRHIFKGRAPKTVEVSARHSCAAGHREV